MLINKPNAVQCAVTADGTLITPIAERATISPSRPRTDLTTSGIAHLRIHGTRLPNISIQRRPAQMGAISAPVCGYDLHLLFQQRNISNNTLVQGERS